MAGLSQPSVLRLWRKCVGPNSGTPPCVWGISPVVNLDWGPSPPPTSEAEKASNLSSKLSLRHVTKIWPIRYSHSGLDSSLWQEERGDEGILCGHRAGAVAARENTQRWCPWHWWCRPQCPVFCAIQEMSSWLVLGLHVGGFYAVYLWEDAPVHLQDMGGSQYPEQANFILETFKHIPK